MDTMSRGLAPKSILIALSPRGQYGVELDCEDITGEADRSFVTLVASDIW
jgi:hypothetical protein